MVPAVGREWCYLLSAKTHDPLSDLITIKVGHTKNLKQRFAPYETHNGNPIEYTALSLLGRSLESRIKNQFQNYRAKPRSREWFRVPVSMLQLCLCDAACSWILDPGQIATEVGASPLPKRIRISKKPRIRKRAQIPTSVHEKLILQRRVLQQFITGLQLKIGHDFELGATDCFTDDELKDVTKDEEKYAGLFGGGGRQRTTGTRIRQKKAAVDRLRRMFKHVFQSPVVIRTATTRKGRGGKDGTVYKYSWALPVTTNLLGMSFEQFLSDDIAGVAA